MKTTSETAFETVIEEVMLSNSYLRHVSKDFDAELAIFPESALKFIRETQLKVWTKLESLHQDKTGERVITAYKEKSHWRK